MKIQYVSDLHLEFDTMPVPEVIGDVLVLAGDIGVGVKHKDWVVACCEKHDNVIMILGNHEFYGSSMQKIRNAWAEMDMPNNFYFLDNDWVTINGVNFIGSTLWSHAHPLCPLNDFRLIKYKYPGGYGKFSTQEAKKLFNENLDWLIKTVAKLSGHSNVVITHHAPSWKVQDPKYAGQDSVVGSGFQTDILHLFDPKDITAWIYGHTHYNTEFIEHGIFCTSNQRGYASYGLADGFDPDKMIDI